MAARWKEASFRSARPCLVVPALCSGYEAAPAHQKPAHTSQVDDKSNEITAIPEPLRALDILACIITTDAMGTQKEVASLIVAEGGDYLLAPEENHPS
jgi:hypothetical protein